MFRRLFSAAAVMCFAVSPLSAQQACPPEKLATAVDTYAREPFSARSWRMLKGLGDPQIEAEPGESAATPIESFVTAAAKSQPDFKFPGSPYGECRADYPLQVLKDYQTSLGPDHPYVKQWLAVQSAVFAACASKEASEQLPPPLDVKDKPQLLAAQDFDRAYQQATLTFYKNAAKSIDLFRPIGMSNSPHKAAARYMMANSLVRTGQFGTARSEAKVILADPALSSIHEITQKLLGFIASREDTAQGWSAFIDDTIAVLEKPASEIQASQKLKADYARALYDIDFIGIGARNDNSWLDGKLPDNPTLSKAIFDAARKHPSVPWMIAGQTANRYFTSGSWQYIGPKWEERMSALVSGGLGLVPGTPERARDALEALSAKSDEASRGALWTKAKAAMKAASDSCGQAPETASAGTLLQHAVRLSALAGQYEEAYAGLDEVPFKTAQAYTEAVLPLGQYLLGQGLLADGRRYRDRFLSDEFLANASWRKSEAVNLMLWLAEKRENWNAALAKLESKTSLPVLNFLPVKELRALAKDSETFSAAERALFIRAAWTRLYAMGGAPDNAFTKEFYDLNPEIAQIRDKMIADYPNLPPPRLRLLTILRTPRFNTVVNTPGAQLMTERQAAGTLDQYDHNDRNWWCPFETDRHLIALREDFDSASQNAAGAEASVAAIIDPGTKPLLDQKRETVLKQHPMIKAVSWKEIARLAAMPGAPKRLTERTIDWAQNAKGDDGAAAEALALAIRATRYGCNWHGGHRAYSQAAHRLLKAKFGGTTWAGQTPYWFDCVRGSAPVPGTDGAAPQSCPPMAWPKQDIPR